MFCIFLQSSDRSYVHLIRLFINAHVFTCLSYPNFWILFSEDTLLDFRPDRLVFFFRIFSGLHFCLVIFIFF